MATGYQAVARLRPVDVPPEREESTLGLLRQSLPDNADIGTERDADGSLLIGITIPFSANDSSEVQVLAQELVAAAAAHAGLTTEAALLDDITVRASS